VISWVVAIDVTSKYNTWKERKESNLPRKRGKGLKTKKNIGDNRCNDHAV